MIFAARQLQEKCIEHHQDLCTTFVDLTVRQFHDGMMARVLDDGEHSYAFPVTNGVKLGCVLATTLFSMVFAAMLTDAFHDSEVGISIRYRMNGWQSVQSKETPSSHQGEGDCSS